MVQIPILKVSKRHGEVGQNNETGKIFLSDKDGKMKIYLEHDKGRKTSVLVQENEEVFFKESDQPVK